MRTFLITWRDQQAGKPDDRGWPHAKLAALVERFKRDESAEEWWRFFAHKAGQVGDMAILYKQGKPPKGIIGLGRLVEPPQRIVESDDPVGKARWRALVRFERIVDPREGFLLTQQEIDAITTDPAPWRANASGQIQLDPEVASRLIEAIQSRSAPVRSPTAGIDWTSEEVLAAVEDYFSMLLDELDGRPYNKAAHNAALRLKLSGRSKGAVERKHMNISSVLQAMGLPCIDGYKPLENSQKESLASAIGSYLESRPDVSERLHAVLTAKPAVDEPVPASLDCIDASPPLGKGVIRKEFRISEFVAARFDFAVQDARNKALGNAGEQFVVDLERLRLKAAGRDDLAQRVRWVARDDGDGAGYDVLSWEASGGPRHIEVKTTNAGASSSFFVTENERRFSEANAATYHLYRVYRFKRDPRVFILSGALNAGLRLEPTAYRAVLSTPSF